MLWRLRQEIHLSARQQWVPSALLSAEHGESGRVCFIVIIFFVFLFNKWKGTENKTEYSYGAKANLNAFRLPFFPSFGFRRLFFTRSFSCCNAVAHRPSFPIRTQRQTQHQSKKKTKKKEKMKTREKKKKKSPARVWSAVPRLETLLLTSRKHTLTQREILENQNTLKHLFVNLSHSFLQLVNETTVKSEETKK